MSRVAILGASSKPERYAHLAQQLLVEKGYTPLPVTPREADVLGVPAVASLNELEQPVDTVTLYVGPAHQGRLLGELLALKPRRVIFNPGTENPELAAALGDAGIETAMACTLVMLRTNQF